MAKKYSVYGTVSIPKRIYDKEKNSILYKLLDWHPENSFADNCYCISDINSFTIGIFFDHVEKYTDNVYYDIAEPLISSLKTLKEKYPDRVLGDILIISTDGEYYAARINLNESGPKLYFLEEQN